ncbi:hypothetical protein [Grimontia indica]|nr:hypothetical protein [Grimontia indica]
MNKSKILLVAMTLILLLMASFNENAIYDEYFAYRADYLAYLLFGYVTCLFVLLNNKVGKWMLIIFYLMQSVTLLPDYPDFYFKTGISIYVSIWDGVIDTPAADRVGFSINALAIGMIALTFAFLKNEPRDNQKASEKQPEQESKVSRGC